MARKRIRIANRKDDLTLDEAFAEFMRKAKIRNLSTETMKTYCNTIKIFFEFMDGGMKTHDISVSDVDEYIFWLKEEKEIRDTTVVNYVRHLRAFLYYCMDCGYIKKFKILMPKSDKEIKETYTDDELKRLLKKPDLKKCTFTEYRIWVFENYLLATGNRISTALNLKIKDIDFGSGVITLRKTKNRHQQIIPLSHTLSDILSEYLVYRDGDEEAYVFCNDFGEQGARRTYQQAVYRYNIKRNVNKTSCHLFRHTFAKKWILNGGDIFRLQKILGHSSVDIVKEYVNMFSNDLQVGFSDFNPLDTLAKPSKTKIKMGGAGKC
ncbi:MAG: tyrosine-type recombinase/integrase [Candidatus Fimousia sp.]